MSADDNRDCQNEHKMVQLTEHSLTLTFSVHMVQMKEKIPARQVFNAIISGYQLFCAVFPIGESMRKARVFE